MDLIKKELETQIPTGVKISSSKDIFGSNKKVLTKSLEFKVPGNYTIGPFIFELNNEIYITDSVIVEVSPQLPFQPGVWVRYIEEDGKKYIILEQYLQNKSDYKKKRNKSSYTVGGITKEGFTTIKNSPQKGVTVIISGSMSTTKREDGTNAFAVGYSYSRKKYKITFSSDFNGVFKLKKSHFEDFPKKMKLDEIIITT